MTNAWRRAAVAGLGALMLVGGTVGSSVAADAAGAAGHHRCVVAPDAEVVRAYEPIRIADDWLMALLPEGEQNFLISPDTSFQEVLEWQRANPETVPGIAPESLHASFSMDVETEEIVLWGGGWRTDCGPARITVESIRDGQTVEVRDAELLRLRGERGWGTFYFDGGVTREDRMVLTAYDARGQILYQREWSRPEQDTVR
ncbi:hypothetical protein E1265_19335 [Streptomyces sp. 8K308]|uniref:hypothetical protein n=1 Tax=Streptomyces sp. 8K308 TaxID=2530388 RepID=UPI0010462DF5|nr:hypothetical protein [Streptomyces sp. 8K308]TDC20984.1 hypothetical protein E1265_19335 [Streptomyces sp. 8K308]